MYCLQLLTTECLCCHQYDFCASDLTRQYKNMQMQMGMRMQQQEGQIRQLQQDLGEEIW